MPLGAFGEPARRLAEALARAEWPRKRSEAHASLARALMAAGAEMRSAKRASVVGATVRSDIKVGRVRERVSRKAVSRRRRAAEEKTNAIRAALDAEAPLWCAASALWATDAGLAAVDAAAPWLEMDRWSEEAGCGAVPALFELLDVRGDEGDEEEASEKDVKFSRKKCSRGATKENGGSILSGGSGARHTRRCAYALLSSRGMLKAAVVGLDADVADVDAVEEAAANAAEEDEEAGAEAEAGGGGGRRAAADENGGASAFRDAAEKAAIRDVLADALEPGRSAAARNSTVRGNPSSNARANARTHAREGRSGPPGRRRRFFAEVFPPRDDCFPLEGPPGSRPSPVSPSPAKKKKASSRARAYLGLPEGALHCWALLLRHVHSLAPGSGARARAAASPGARARPARSSTPSRGRFPSSLRPMRRRRRGSGATC